MDYERHLYLSIQAILTCPIEYLQNREMLTIMLGNVGLFHESRNSPGTTANLYGDDVKYMLPPNNNRAGMWQTPSQLADFLIHLSTKSIKTYLDTDHPF